MKTIKGALGIDPGRTMRGSGQGSGQLGQQHRAQQMQQDLLAGGPPAKGSGQLGQYNRAQQLAQQQMRPVNTQGPQMTAPQAPQTGGGFMMPQQAPQVGGGLTYNPQAPQTGGGLTMGQGAGIGNFMQNQIGQIPQRLPMQSNVNDMTAQQRNPNYIQGR